MRKIVALLSALFLIPAAAPAAVIGIVLQADAGGISAANHIVTGQGTLTTMGDEGTFTLSGLSSFSVTGTDRLLTLSGPYSIGLSDLTSFSITLTGGHISDIFLTTRAIPTTLGVVGTVPVTSDSLAFTVLTTSTSNLGIVTSTDRLSGFFAVGYQGPTGAVPEPATWTMLIGGFGIVGAALRRRGRTLATC